MFNQLPDELFVKNNPELFPHFHAVDGYPEYLESLDKFICLFSFEIRKYFKSTYDTLLEYFNEDLLRFYLELLRFDSEIFNDLDNYFLSNKVVMEKAYLRLGRDICIPKFKAYIMQSDFAEKTELIREILNYESDRMKYYYLEDNEPVVKKYMFDVIDICIKNQNKQVAEYDLTTVEFVRDGRKVIARRITG
ncbi:hypothetical protein CEB3_c10380 [Peptococcaceae bacterium CEB3]|nr:hypothetical protein CEB3_c10380 [Peptococcaceae bacterium CEB3]